MEFPFCKSCNRRHGGPCNVFYMANDMANSMANEQDDVDENYHAFSRLRKRANATMYADRGPEPDKQDFGGGYASQIARRVAVDTPASATYKYRDIEKRREYQREYMRERRLDENS